jgi:NAD(P)-dependent dehydrogenase (short-subunit alcohol dehydrogenase family)
MKLAEKTCLITGGTRGIGAATAIELASKGAKLALAARRMDNEALQTQQKIQGLGSACHLIPADLSLPQDARRCVEETIRRYGAIDILVHAAGGPAGGSLLELTPEKWHAAFDVHLHAIFHLCQAAAPHMKQRSEGAIILISSSAGIRALKTNVAYQAVKGAIPQLTRALAFELADANIRVNCVAPGIIRTAFHATMPSEVQQFNMTHRIPLHREGTPEQVATVIAELATNDYITGETVSIDGGLTMRIA